MIAPRWYAHSYDVRPKSARVVICHLTDEVGVPMCGDPGGDRIAEIGVDYHPVNTLACAACLVLSNPKGSP